MYESDLEVDPKFAGNGLLYGHRHRSLAATENRLELLRSSTRVSSNFDGIWFTIFRVTAICSSYVPYNINIDDITSQDDVTIHKDSAFCNYKGFCN